MAAKPLPHPDILRLCFTYDPDTGLFIHLEKPEFLYGSARLAQSVNSRCAGKPAFNIYDPKGYFTGGFLNVRYMAHRVAWAMIAGEWPERMIDHRDHNGFNNKWENLRLADHSENGCNARMRADNKTGFRGVSWNKRDRKWQAMITCNNRQTNLGVHDTPEIAAMVYDEAARRMHGSFATTNF